MKKRNRLDIIHDILNAIVGKGGKIKPTHLLYKSNLSHGVMESYIKELITNGMIEEHKSGRSRTYSITDRGRDFIAKYKSFAEFVDSYGLSDEEYPKEIVN